MDKHININMGRPKKDSSNKSTSAQDIKNLLNSVPVAREPKVFNKLSPEKKEIFVKKLQNLLAEFMDCYMLIGFSVDGLETVVVETHGTPLETRGLNDLAYDFFNQHFSSPLYQIQDEVDED